MTFDCRTIPHVANMIQTTTLICKLVFNLFFFTSSESSLNTPLKKRIFLHYFIFQALKCYVNIR